MRLTITTSLRMVWVLLLVALPKRTEIDLDIQINNNPLCLLNVFIVYTYIYPILDGISFGYICNTFLVLVG